MSDSTVKMILQGDASGMISAMQRASAQAKQFEGTISGITSSAIRMSGALAGLAGITSLGALVKQSIDTADQMSKMSQKVGVAIEQLSGMAHAANLADVSTEQLGKGMGKLAKAMYDAAGDSNSGPAKTFQALGIAVTDASGKLRGTDEVMMDVAERFAGMKDGAGKTALAMELFGKAGADLIPMLNEGKAGLKESADEARRFGTVLTAEAGKQAEEFNDNLTRLKARASGLAITMANDLLPQINAFVDRLAKGGDIQSSPFILGLHSLEAEIMRMAMLADKAGGSITALGYVMSGGKFTETGRWWKEQNEIYKQRYLETEKAMQTLANLEVGLDASGNPIKPAGVAGKGSSNDEPPIVKNIKAAEKAAKAAGKSLAEEYKKQAQELFSAVLDIHDAYAAAIQGEGNAFSLKYSASGDLSTGDRYKITPLSQYSLMSGEQHTIPQTTAIPQAAIAAEAVFRQIIDMQAQLEARDPWAGLISGIQAYTAEAANLAAQFDNLAIHTMQNMEDALTDFVTTGKLDFRDLANSIISDLVRIQMRAAVSGIFGMVGNAIGGLLSGASSINSDYSFLNSGGLLSGRASGGPVLGGQTYLIGERGPELFTPGASGMITPNDALGGSTRLTVNIVNQSGQPVKAKEGSTQFDGRNMIKTIVLEAMDTDPGFRWAMRGAQ